MKSKSLTGIAALVAAAGALTAASPAAAYTCSASALRGTVLTQTGLEPAVAGGDAGCIHDIASIESLPAPLAGIAGAATDLTGPADSPAQQKASALAGLQNFALGSLRSVPVSLPEPQIPSGLDSLSVPLPANLGLLGLPSVITVNALPAALEQIPIRQLPDVPIAAIRSLRSLVGAQCLSGLPNLVGASAVQGLTGLGENLPTAEPVDRIVTLLGEQTIPLSGMDVTKIQLPAGLSFSDALTGAALKAAVEQVVAGLPPIILPAAVGRVQTTTDEQSAGDGSLEQRALHMTVTMAGRQVADLVMGIARVALDGLSCAEAAVAPVVEQVAPTQDEAPAPVAPASQLAVSCAKASVTLVNVIDQDDHVTLIGAAAKKLIGKRVNIISTWNGKRVATTRVGRSGFFRTTAGMPRQSLRYTNRARYMAVVGDEKSLPLKLHRRMRFSTLEHHGNRVVLRGRVFGPMTNRRIVIKQAVSCTKDVIVKRIKPRSNGYWKAVVRAPKGSRAATYRASTYVVNPGSDNPFPTFTLPGYVSL